MFSFFRKSYKQIKTVLIKNNKGNHGYKFAKQSVYNSEQGKSNIFKDINCFFKYIRLAVSGQNILRTNSKIIKNTHTNFC